MRDKRGQLELEHWIIILLGIAIVGLVVYGIYFYKPTNKEGVTKEECVNFMKGVSAKVNLVGVKCPKDMMFLNEQAQLVFYHFCEVQGDNSVAYVLIPGVDVSKPIKLVWYYQNKTMPVESSP